MTAKSDLLNRAAVEYNALEAAMHGLNQDQLAVVWFGTWSVRDIVAHLSGWHRAMGPALERIARGEKPIPDGVSYDDVDGWNATFVAAVGDAPADVLLLELDRSHEDFMHLAGQVPDERVEPGRTAYRIIDACSAEHYKEHADHILDWRRAAGL